MLCACINNVYLRNCYIFLSLQSTVTMDGDKLVHVQKWDGKETKFVREIKDGKMTMVKKHKPFSPFRVIKWIHSFFTFYTIQFLMYIYLITAQPDLSLSVFLSALTVYRQFSVKLDSIVIYIIFLIIIFIIYI